MSGGHAIVTGEKIRKVPRILKLMDSFGLGTNFVNGEHVYTKINDLIRSMLDGVSSQYDMLTNITVLGYGFENEGNIGSSLEEFIELQDVLVQNNMKSVKLYLVTKNADLYDRINQDYSGREVLVYQNTEVHLVKEMDLGTISKIMSGSYDGSGIRPKRKDTLTRHQRVELERKRLEEEAMQVEKETLEYEKDIPQSKLNKDNYVGSAQASAKRTRIEKERLDTTRKAERLDLDYYVDEWGDITVYDERGLPIDDLDAYELELREQKRQKKRQQKQSGRQEPQPQVRKSRAEIEMERQQGFNEPQQHAPRQEPVAEEPDWEEPLWEDSGFGGTSSTMDFDFSDDYMEQGSSDNTQVEPEPEPMPKPTRRRTNPNKGNIGKSYPVGSSSSANGNGETSNYTPFKENIRVTGRDSGATERVESLSTVKVLFNDLLSDGMSLVEDKLHDDEVVMAVSSSKGSGGSGLTAQIAEVYAMLGRKVVILDLDLNGRGQTYYFNNYDQRVSENKGIANAMVNVMDGGVINKASVSVNSRIDICGISTSLSAIDERYKETIARNLNSVLMDAKEFYDIVLVDIPIEDFSLYSRNSLQSVERYLFVSENKEYEIERLFRQYLGEFVESSGLLVNDIFNNSTIVLNKYDNRNRDEQGYHINKQWLKDKLYEKGSPYDSILVSGEIPHAPRFEEQFLTNQRYVWQDSGYMATIKNMLKEAV